MWYREIRARSEISLCAQCTSFSPQDKTAQRRETTAIQFLPLTLPLIPLLLCSLILWPQGPHPPRPTKLPLITDLSKFHIQYAHWNKEKHRRLDVYIKPFVISSSILEQNLNAHMTGTLAL